MSTFTAEICPQCGAKLPLAAEQVVCQYCGVSLMRTGAASQEALAGKPAAERAGLVQGMHLKPFAYTDTQGLGVEAFRMLVPSGWEFTGGVFWPMVNPGMPGVVGFQVRNPGGEETFEVFPSLSFYWTNNPMAQMIHPRGSLYYGNEVQPPCPALQALSQIVVPRYRGQVGPLEIVQQESLPQLPGQLRAQSPVDTPANVIAEGARLRLRYPHGEKSIDEELYGVVQMQRAGMPTMMGVEETIFWSIDYLFSFRALSDRLDGLKDLFQTVLYSFRLNPDWYARYLQLSQMIIQGQIKHIQQIGQVSRMISQTSDQIREMSMQSYNQRQETMDRLSTGFSQYMRGVEEYQNPFEERGVELPSGYNHAWANSLGEYIVSNDANYNPNIGSNLNWEPLERKS